MDNHKKAVQVYLASQSPRRAELLSQMGVTFSRLSISVVEEIAENESCDEYISRLALEKAMAGAKCLSTDGVVIGADTVVLYEGCIFEKPSNALDARKMMRCLSDDTHCVKTAVSICSFIEGKIVESSILQTSYVTMKKISDAEISAYWHTGEPKDKAGGYGIQGLGAVFIKHIEGSYSGIMGLPIYETARLLNKFAVNPFNNER